MRATLLFTIVFFHLPLFTQGQSWLSKIDSNVWQTALDGHDIDFLIVLSEQADISESAFFPKKEDKGAYVFQQLSSLATRSQVIVLKTILDFHVPHKSFWIINAVWVKGGKMLLEALARLPEVAEIQANPMVHFAEPVRSGESGDRTIEWGIDNINADDVWAMGYTGQDVVVAGQDTGYDWDVPALKLKYRGWDETSQTADHNFNWHDAIHSDPGNDNPCGFNSPEPCDDHNHGTHTMGTMAGSEGANEIGVAPSAKWIGCRNMDEGNGTLATYIECFEWFLAPTDLNGNNPDPSKAPHVVNNSWYCPSSEGCDIGNWNTMEIAINNLLGAGVVVVASAGNDGSLGCSSIKFPPAIFAGSFTVGATNSSNAIASFSSRGPVTADGSNRMKPDVSAPGVNVRSCIIGGGYDTYSGTSMAGPHVAGTVALLISADPSLAGQVGMIESFIKNNAGGQTSTEGCGTDTPTSSPNNTYGHGIIDALAAVNDALGLLPVELIDFSATLTNEGILLYWETALPGSLNHFEIEHAGQIPQWDALGKLAFSTITPLYSFLDKNATPGTHYYRLKMVDIDGSFTYSKVISIHLADQDRISISPNPAKGEIELMANLEHSGIEVLIFDSSGRLVIMTGKIDSEENEPMSVPVDALPSGVYFLKIIAVDNHQVLFQDKFIKT